MTISLTTLVVLIANGITAVIAVAMLMLVLWQDPHQPANRWFAVVMASLAAYVSINAFARFVDPLDLDPLPVFYLATTLYGIFVVSIFFFASEFAVGRSRVARAMQIIGIVLVVVPTILLWTGEVTTNTRPLPNDEGGYTWDYTPVGNFVSLAVLGYSIVSAVVLARSDDERARSLWPAPVLTIAGLVSAVLIWPRINIPLNAVFLALAAITLGLPVLRQQLFNPLANAHAELLRKNRELERMNRVKSQFLATVSHELRTPLNSINGYSETMLEGVYGPLNEVQRDRLEKVLRNGRQLLSLINDVLDLNQIERGRLRLHIAPVPLEPLVDAVLDTCGPLAAQKGLKLLREYAGAPVVRGDEVRLREIMMNVVANACKFTEEGAVTVRAQQSGAMVRLEVSDTGVGIPPEQLDSVFMEFQQLSGQGASGEGTGLGMAIAKQLVELHGGNIWLESVPGEGTTVYITLPVADTRLNAPVTVEGSAPPSYA
mgnify:CR=1 FL=1